MLLKASILAVVTLDMATVSGGGAPVFFARDVASQEKMALYLGKILDATAHDLGNGTLVLVRH